MRFHLVAVLAFSLGCAASALVSQGNQLLAEGKHSEAVAKFEEALKVDPGNEEAKERIRHARREAVRAQLDGAEQALAGGEYAVALRDSQRARRMPLDLEDVDLVRRIDDTIAKSAQLAERRVEAFVEQGHFVPAVELSGQVRDASPGVASRDRWAREVQSRAAEHYLRLAQESETTLPGTAAVQLAMARRSGASVDAAKVGDLWNRFALPTCFAEPKVSVADKTGKAGELKDVLVSAAAKALLELRARCGEGTQSLGVTITIANLSLVDKVEKQRAVKPLPGTDLETEEVYYEEEPYTVVEEVIEDEVRKELREKRDCAPRPGKERGCRTWTEEVEVRVPKKVVKEVQKVRRIEKRRPIVHAESSDKVVAYDLTRLTRRVAVSGRVEVLGAVGEPRAFSLVEESIDEAHAEVTHPKLTIPQNPLEAKEMKQLIADASAGVSREVGAAVAAAAMGWSRRFEDEAQKQVLAGRLPEAEELYLKLMALGVEASKPMAQFFEKRYGRSVDQVMAALATALGRVVETTRAGEPAQVAGASVFPKLSPSNREAAPEKTDTPLPPTTVRQAPATPMVPKRQGAGEKKPSMSEDELKALEEESIATTKPPEPAPEAAPGAEVPPGTPPPAAPPAPAPAPEQKVEEDGSQQPKTRAPIKPKT